MTSSSKRIKRSEEDLGDGDDRRRALIWSKNNSVYVRINLFQHGRGECWCEDTSPSHREMAPRLDISSVHHGNRLFNTINAIWETRPKDFLGKNKVDHMLVLTAVVGIAYARSSRDSTTTMCEEIRRSVNVPIINENIASSALYIYTYLSGELRALEDGNKDILFKRVLGLDLIASASRVSVSEGRQLKRFTYTNKNHSIPVMALESNIAVQPGGTKRKVSAASNALPTEDRFSLFIPRDFEVHYGVSTHSHPYLLASHQSERKVTFAPAAAVGPATTTIAPQTSTVAALPSNASVPSTPPPPPPSLPPAPVSTTTAATTPTATTTPSVQKPIMSSHVESSTEEEELDYDDVSSEESEDEDEPQTTSPLNAPIVSAARFYANTVERSEQYTATMPPPAKLPTQKKK